MSGSKESLEARVCELERWRDQQITRDTVTVTGFGEKFDAVHARLRDIRASIALVDGRIDGLDGRIGDLNSRIGDLDGRIGDLDGRSVASRLISMSIDIGNLMSRQDSMDAKIGSMDDRIGSMDDRIGSMDDRIGSMYGRLATVESGVGDIKTDVAQILSILRKPNGDK
ncbi:hypothetical protein ACFWF7_30545 [Nocardia sp. NPDC060256]|uniref:hypothetical protein n=1 Tax=unclassified Nocardia TaxID=2637762 RepID=UPI00365756EB